METAEISLDTQGSHVVDLTAEAARFCRPLGDGLLSVFAPHATAGVALMELGAGSEPDLAEALERLLPRDDRYLHRHGSPGHGADHLLPVLVSPSLVIPVVGIGVAPCTALAANAGLECNNGICTDAQGRTSGPDIFAAGDCANSPRSRYGRSVRLESVDNAVVQANVVGAALLGTPPPAEHVPWFWSDQYARKLVIVGLPLDHDAIVTRGNPESDSFSVCYLRGRQLVAIETVNAPRDQIAARQLIPARAGLDLTKIPDAAVPLKDCAAG